MHKGIIFIECLCAINLTNYLEYCLCNNVDLVLREILRVLKKEVSACPEKY